MLADVQAVAFDFRGDPQTGDDLGDERRYAGLLEWVDGVAMQCLIENKPDIGFIVDSFSLLGEIMAECHNQAVSWAIPQISQGIPLTLTA